MRRNSTAVQSAVKLKRGTLVHSQLQGTPVLIVRPCPPPMRSPTVGEGFWPQHLLLRPRRSGVPKGLYLRERSRPQTRRARRISSQTKGDVRLSGTDFSCYPAVLKEHDLLPPLLSCSTAMGRGRGRKGNQKAARKGHHLKPRK